MQHKPSVRGHLSDFSIQICCSRLEKKIYREILIISCVRSVGELDKVFISVHYHSRDEQYPINKSSHFSSHLGCFAAMFELNLTSNVQLMNPPLKYNMNDHGGTLGIQLRKYA